jgi:excinuclease ABC subunit C
MERLSEALDFEAAALIRDRIRALSLVQGHQDIHVAGMADADVIAAHQAGGHTCVQVFFFRGGHNWGNRAYFPSHDRQMGVEEVLTSFVGQFYDNRAKPPLVLLSHHLVEEELIAEALSLNGGKVTLAVPQRGDKKRLVDRIIGTAREALGRRLAESSTQRILLEGVATAFGLESPVERIEVYDNSHIQGSHPVGAMIVAGPDGLMKNAYRKFNIRGPKPEAAEPGKTPGKAPTPTLPRERGRETAGDGGEASESLADAAQSLPTQSPPPPPNLSLPRQRGRAGVGAAGTTRELSASSERAAAGTTETGAPDSFGGDDFAMMREVFRRRFGRALKEDPGREGSSWPDLVLIDGGQGQLTAAQQVFAELGIEDVPLASIAKGPDRNAGRERFFTPGKPPFSLEMRDPVLYFLQRLRDEAHRFAIGAHRTRRTMAIGVSPLDEIAGIGSKRKQALLHHFGSARSVARAGLAEIERVNGISKTVAKKVYEHFHADG